MSDANTQHPTLFTPIQLGPHTLPNRLVMAPMTRNRAGEGNVASDLAVTYYEQRASAGLIVTEGTVKRSSRMESSACGCWESVSRIEACTRNAGVGPLPNAGGGAMRIGRVEFDRNGGSVRTVATKHKIFGRIANLGFDPAGIIAFQCDSESL